MACFFKAPEALTIFCIVLQFIVDKNKILYYNPAWSGNVAGKDGCGPGPDSLNNRREHGFPELKALAMLVFHLFRARRQKAGLRLDR